MTILAIETSCDETAVAVITESSPRNEGNPRIKSNIIASQVKLHAKYGGIVPEVAAREHVPTIIPTVDLALKKAGVKLTDINAIAVTQGPGLITSLLVGVQTAKTLGMVLGKPVIPVNHLEAHIYANFAKSKVKSQKSKVFPALILIVSGGHTLLVLMSGHPTGSASGGKNHGQYKILGETLDDAAGEAFDKTAKLLKLGYPGGPQLAKLAQNGNPSAFKFPRPMINSKNLNFSFSGLKTAVLYTVQRIVRTSKKLDNRIKWDLAASVQQAIVDVLIAKTEQAIKKYHPKTIMLGGGVAANELLRRDYQLLSINHQLNCSVPPLELTTDNAAMIGLAAYYRLLHGKTKVPVTFETNPNLVLK